MFISRHKNCEGDQGVLHPRPDENHDRADGCDAVDNYCACHDADGCLYIAAKLCSFFRADGAVLCRLSVFAAPQGKARGYDREPEGQQRVGDLEIFTELHLTVLCFDRIYTAVQFGSRMNIVVMFVQIYLNGNGQGEKISAGAAALPDQMV